MLIISICLEFKGQRKLPHGEGRAGEGKDLFELARFNCQYPRNRQIQAKKQTDGYPSIAHSFDIWHVAKGMMILEKEVYVSSIVRFP